MSKSNLKLAKNSNESDIVEGWAVEEDSFFKENDDFF